MMQDLEYGSLGLRCGIYDEDCLMLRLGCSYPQSDNKKYMEYLISLIRLMGVIMRIKIVILIVAGVLFFSIYAMAGNFTDNGDGTVTDSNTGLMWQQGEAGSMNWEDAITCCEGLSLAGYTDWRLPNIKELESITDDSLYNPAIDTNYFPDVYTSSYWSSTTHAGDSSDAWCVYFYDGSVSCGDSDKSDTYYVRCVRGGE